MMRDVLLLVVTYVALAWVPGVGWRWMLALAGAPVASGALIASEFQERAA